jgi:hypothetical protein
LPDRCSSRCQGGRRRACEADILELFDDWRRAVGVTQLVDESADAAVPAKRDSLPAHLDRAIARLTAMRSSESAFAKAPADRAAPRAFDGRLDEAVRELDRVRAAAKQARGEARIAILDRLAALDRELLDAARAEIDDDRRAALIAEAQTEIAPFAARMTAEARAKAIDAAFDRLVRDAIGLPVLSHEP